jgi:hypothetical protein
MKRYDIERAVERARLPSASVAIMMMLLRRIDAKGGEIPPGRQPSLSMIASAAGCHRSTVMRHLRALETAGWITRIRPPLWLAQRYHVTTAYAMHIPSSYPQARRRGDPGHAADSEEARRAAEQEIAARDAAASRAAHSGLDAPGADAGRTPGHKSEGPSEQLSEHRSEAVTGDGDLPQRAAQAAVVRDELAALTGRKIPLRDAVQIARVILEGRPVRDAGAYLREALRRDPQRYLPAGDQSAQTQADYYARARERSEAIARSEPKE